jgi:hypothetical protein
MNAPLPIDAVLGDHKIYLGPSLAVEFPYMAHERGYMVLDPEKLEGQHRWTYEAESRPVAAKLLGYIRAAHPDAKDLKLSIK